MNNEYNDLKRQVQSYNQDTLTHPGKLMANYPWTSWRQDNGLSSSSECINIEEGIVELI